MYHTCDYQSSPPLLFLYHAAGSPKNDIALSTYWWSLPRDADIAAVVTYQPAGDPQAEQA
jgi:hypothetical protein